MLGPISTAKTRLLSVNRTQFRVFTSILTGYNDPERHLYIIRLIDNPLCRRCGEEEENSIHDLCECEALASFRYTYLDSFSWSQRMLEV
jgi:hypothetical protein